MSDGGDLLAELRRTGADVLRPGAERSEVVGILTEVVGRLLEVDDCWLQSPGPFAELLLDAHDTTGGVSTDNVDSGPLSTGGTAGRRRGTGVATAPVVVDGERHVLVAWQVGVRAWTTRDRALLRGAAAELGRVLEQAATTASADQHARARFDELRTELLVTLDHELRTPMTILRTGLELLEDATEGALSEHAWLLERLQSSMDRLRGVADDVGQLARASAAPDTAVPVTVSVAEVVRRVAEDQPRQVDVRLDPRAGDLVAAIEGQELRVVLHRLLDNAVKFSDEDGSVEVTARRLDDGVEVVVSDDGIGIADDELFALGEPFARTRETKRLEHQGPGLGLAVVRSILGRWRGRLVLARRPEGGTEARVWVPAAA